MIEETTSEIKSLSLSVKNNFLKIGSLLKEIRDSECYKEKYLSFNSYLESEEFCFSKQHAYKLIKVFEDFGSDSVLCDKLSFTRLVQLTYVHDSTIRKELEAVVVSSSSNVGRSFDAVYSKVKRASERTTEVVKVGDSAELKCERQLKTLLADLEVFYAMKTAFGVRCASLKEFALKYPSNAVIQGLVIEIGKKMV